MNETGQKQLLQWYNTLPKNDYKRLRNQVIDACGITKTVFYNWLRGTTPLPKLAKKEIERIAEKPIFSTTKEENTL